MAEKRESNKGEFYRCLSCGEIEVIMPNNPRKDGRVCKNCGGKLDFKGFAGIDFVGSNSISISNLHIDVDVSDALKGLKALKREANEVVKVLNQLAEVLNGNEDVAKKLISVFTTQELQQEIVDREAINK